MKMIDAAGHAVSGANADGLAAFEQGAHELRCFIGDPVASVDSALDTSPQMVMAHALKAYLHLLGTEPAGLPVAREYYEAAIKLPANDRERQHLEAIRLLTDGRWRDAGRTLEDLSVVYPRDALALQAGHQIDFFTGDSRMLRDRIARALPTWSKGLPGYHAVLGMYAFGLEETGDYAQAEKQGRASVELERRDGWGQHAVAHVMEMQNRLHDGIAWMRADPDAWSHESFFAVHNWWHLALYHLEVCEIDEVLRLFDGPIYGPRDGKRSTVILEMVDASALLWRMHLRGVDVGNRWDALADNWAPFATEANYAFNDLHAMMAFVGSHRIKLQQAVFEAQRAAMEGSGDNVAFTREVGHAATRAIKAFGDGSYAETVGLLRPIRSYAHRFGGSHAQRDVLDLTLIEAAFRSGDQTLAAALAVERITMRPHSPLARLFVARGRDLAQAA
ncbi:MAG: tetratricopeptide repeat protein [Burkholderiales bacterium]